ncbi:jacalin-related lectin 3-like [Asparagus officinalis]|uniref:jacalin-related lectin 3-like n=1 Tax=Asparagus officinalis TaxID=4686 RepID=UPI00098E22F3|nr:jacalin-related lectin 3-like [Asparagus officinalis]
MGDRIYIKAGPAGGKQGQAWDDGIFHSVTAIFLTYTTSRIVSIQFAYADERGNRRLSLRRGGAGGNSFEAIQITGPITSVSGSYSMISGRPAHVQSLVFDAGGVRHGPYGYASGSVTAFGRGTTQFSFSASGNRIRGFHGYSDGFYLQSIGVYIDSGTTSRMQASPSSYPKLLEAPKEESE